MTTPLSMVVKSARVAYCFAALIAVAVFAVMCAGFWGRVLTEAWRLGWGVFS